jgi:hypothetical protein
VLSYWCIMKETSAQGLSMWVLLLHTSAQGALAAGRGLPKCTGLELGAP